jgi:hypothetical protein
MANRFDIQLNNNDMIIDEANGGDFLLTESDDQHIIDTINMCPGWSKENPSDGVAILTYIKSRNKQQLLSKNIKLQLQSDNYNSQPNVSYNSDGSLNVDPNVSVQ